MKVGSMGSAEIDFVAMKEGEIIYVQVAQELSKQGSVAREFCNLLKIKDNYPKLVVSSEKNFESSYEGIKLIYIRDFLSIELNFA